MHNSVFRQRDSSTPHKPPSKSIALYSLTLQQHPAEAPCRSNLQQQPAVSESHSQLRTPSARRQIKQIHSRAPCFELPLQSAVATCSLLRRSPLQRHQRSQPQVARQSRLCKAAEVTQRQQLACEMPAMQRHPSRKTSLNWSLSKLKPPVDICKLFWQRLW